MTHELDPFVLDFDPDFDMLICPDNKPPVKRFVNELKQGDNVQTQFLVTEKNLTKFTQANRNGEYFLRLRLADISGSIAAVVWENGLEFANMFKVGDVVIIRGNVSEYKGQPQIVVHDISVPLPDEIDRRNFQRCSPRGQDEMLQELDKEISNVKNIYLSRLLNSFFGDTDFLMRFATAPAGKSVHHNYVGGLLEHTLETVAICKRIIKLYPRLNRDLLISGALLHDMGKIEEYDAKSLALETTTIGKLIGHITIGVRLLNEQISTIANFPNELSMELTHILLSHHGQKEWGSPETPKTFEAFALHYADLVSAKLNQFALVMDKGQENGWTEWDRLLERSVYVGIDQDVDIAGDFF